jgi:hypothetical protein
VKSTVGDVVLGLCNFGPDLICRSEWNMMSPGLGILYKFCLFVHCFLECEGLKANSLLRYPTLFKKKGSMQLLLIIDK